MKAKNLSTLCNFEYFGGEIERLYKNLQSGSAETLPTRVIRVLAEVEEDVNQYNSCVGYCLCRSAIDLQTQEFFVDFLSFPKLQTYCSLKCVQKYIKNKTFISLNGEYIEPFDRLLQQDIDYGSVDPIPNIATIPNIADIMDITEE